MISFFVFSVQLKIPTNRTTASRLPATVASSAQVKCSTKLVAVKVGRGMVECATISLHFGNALPQHCLSPHSSDSAYLLCLYWFFCFFFLAFRSRSIICLFASHYLRRRAPSCHGRVKLEQICCKSQYKNTQLCIRTYIHTYVCRRCRCGACASVYAFWPALSGIFVAVAATAIVVSILRCCVNRKITM